MNKISFVYFDVGGVVIKDFSDTDKWEKTLRHIGVPPKLLADANKIFKQIDDDLCKGLIHLDEFLKYLNAKLGLDISTSIKLQEYVISNFELNEGIHPIIKSLSSIFRIGLLTDQYLGMFNEIKARGLFPPNNWEEIIDSTKVGVRKPDPKIYQIAEERAGVPGNEIRFIDNRDKNLVPARARGWQTFLYDSKDYAKANNELSDYLQTII